MKKLQISQSNKYFFSIIVPLVAVISGSLIFTYQEFSQLKSGFLSFCNRFKMLCESVVNGHNVSIPLVFGIFIGIISTSLVIFVLSILFYVIKTKRFVSTLLTKKVNSHQIKELTQKLDLSGKVQVFESDHFIAFTYGYLSPRICISNRYLLSLDDKELEAVLMHEKDHLTKRDPLKILILKSLVNAFFYIPVMRSISNEFQASREIDIDKKVMLDQKTDENIGSALLKILKSNLQLEDQSKLAIGPFGYSKDRVKGIIDKNYMRRPVISITTILISLISITGFALLFTSNASAISDYEVSTCPHHQSMNTMDETSCMVDTSINDYWGQEHCDLL